MKKLKIGGYLCALAAILGLVGTILTIVRLPRPWE